MCVCVFVLDIFLLNALQRSLEMIRNVPTHTQSSVEFNDGWWIELAAQSEGL